MAQNVRIGIIGTSNWADQMHLPSLRNHPDAHLAAICGRNQARAEEMAEKYGVARVYTDYHEMLRSRELDAVVVATPDDLHHPIVMEALSENLHVLCEKPMAMSAAQAKEMYEAAEDAGVKHMLMFTLRFIPRYRLIKQLMQQDYIGRFLHGHFDWINGWFHRQGEYRWYFDPEHSMGAVSAIGSHMIDLARWYLGEIDSVNASLATVGIHPGPDGGTWKPTHDSAMVTATFENGGHASFHLSTVNLAGQGLRHVGQVITLQGYDGTLESWTKWPGTDAESELLGMRDGDKEAERVAIPTELWGEASPNDFRDLFATESVGPRLFVDGIVNDVPISPNFYDGYKVQQVIEAALESQRTGHTVSVAEMP